MPKISWTELENLRHDGYEARRIISDAKKVLKGINPKAIKELDETDDRLEAFIAKIEVLTTNHEKEQH